MNLPAPWKTIRRLRRLRRVIPPACRRQVGVTTNISLRPCRHSSESSPAWMQVVERRQEQAAEESSG